MWSNVPRRSQGIKAPWLGSVPEQTARNRRRWVSDIWPQTPAVSPDPVDNVLCRLGDENASVVASNALFRELSSVETLTPYIGLFLPPQTRKSLCRNILLKSSVSDLNTLWLGVNNKCVFVQVNVFHWHNYATAVTSWRLRMQYVHVNPLYEPRFHDMCSRQYHGYHDNCMFMSSHVITITCVIHVAACHFILNIVTWWKRFHGNQVLQTAG